MIRKKWMRVAIPIISIIIALLIASIIIIWIGEGTFADRIKFLIEAYTELIKGAFGNKTAIMNTIIKMTPLILTGLAVGFGFRAGVFNIGAEGQMAMGALTASIFAVNASALPMVIAIPMTIIVGMLAGAVW